VALLAGVVWFFMFFFWGLFFGSLVAQAEDALGGEGYGGKFPFAVAWGSSATHEPSVRTLFAPLDGGAGRGQRTVCPVGSPRGHHPRAAPGRASACCGEPARLVQFGVSRCPSRGTGHGSADTEALVDPGLVAM